MKTPCHNCPDRSAECHATCGKYAEFAAWREKERERLRLENMNTAGPGLFQALKDRAARQKQNRKGRT